MATAECGYSAEYLRHHWNGSLNELIDSANDVFENTKGRAPQIEDFSLWDPPPPSKNPSRGEVEAWRQERAQLKNLAYARWAKEKAQWDRGRNGERTRINLLERCRDTGKPDFCGYGTARKAAEQYVRLTAVIAGGSKEVSFIEDTRLPGIKRNQEKLNRHVKELEKSGEKTPEQLSKNIERSEKAETKANDRKDTLTAEIKDHKQELKALIAKCPEGTVAQ